MKTSEKERMIKKYLGCNTPKWVINNCLSLLTEFEEKEIFKVEPDVVNENGTEREALHIDSVSSSLLSEIEKDLGNRTRKFELWHDGAEWMLSLNGDVKQCKTLRELIYRNDR